MMQHWATINACTSQKRPVTALPTRLMYESVIVNIKWGNVQRELSAVYPFFYYPRAMSSGYWHAICCYFLSLYVVPLLFFFLAILFRAGIGTKCENKSCVGPLFHTKWHVVLKRHLPFLKSISFLTLGYMPCIYIQIHTFKTSIKASGIHWLAHGSTDRHTVGLCSDPHICLYLKITSGSRSTEVDRASLCLQLSI